MTARKRSICVVVELLTDHLLLDPDAMDVSSAEATMAFYKPSGRR